MAVSENDLVVGPLTPASGVATISLDFFFEEASWLEVYKSGSETPLVLGVDYTVSGEGTSSGFVTLTTAANGTDKYSVYLAVPLERSSDMQLRGEFKSGPFNLEMDRLWQRLQYHWTHIQRTLRLSATGDVDTILPNINPNQAFGLSEDGSAIVGVDLTVAAVDEPVFSSVTDVANSPLGYASLPLGAAGGDTFTVDGVGFVSVPATSSDYYLVTNGGVRMKPRDGAIANLSAATLKAAAINLAAAEDMSEDFSGMVGYAAEAGTTGGGSGNIYWVTNGSDSRFGYTEGSFRWAVEQVRANGSGRVLFDPRRKLDIALTYQIETPPNITIDAPGRNVTIWRPEDVTGIKFVSDNAICRRLKFGTVVGETATKRDALWVEPTLCDKIWIDQCSFEWCADGCIDMVSLDDFTDLCRVTVSRCIFRNHDKVMLIGSLTCYQDGGGSPAWCPTAADETPKLLVTLYKNLHDHVGQRNPKVVSKAFVHSVNNVHRLMQVTSDLGAAGAAYGILAGTGGSVLSEGDLFTTATGSGFSATASAPGPFAPRNGGTLAIDGPGLVKVVGSVAANGMTVEERLPSLVTVPPYSLVAADIVDSIAGKLAFSDTILATAGAAPDAAPDGVFVWSEASTAEPDGRRVVALGGDISGRFVRVDAPGAAPLVADTGALTVAADGVQFGISMLDGSDRAIETDADSGATRFRAIAVARRSTLTISGGAITVTEGYHTVGTEGGAGTDDLDTINFADTPFDGQEVTIMPSSAGFNITVKHGTGNILLPGGADIVLDGGFAETLTLMWAAHRSRMVLKSK